MTANKTPNNNSKNLVNCATCSKHDFSFPLRFLKETSRWQIVGFCMRQGLTVYSRAVEWIKVSQAVTVSFVRNPPLWTPEDSHGGAVTVCNFIGCFSTPKLSECNK